MPDVYVLLEADGTSVAVARTREVAPNVNVDYDQKGRAIGVEILSAESVQIDGKDVT